MRHREREGLDWISSSLKKKKTGKSQTLIYPKQSCWTDADMGKEFGFQINCLDF